MNLSEQLIAWYKLNYRDLPWRNTQDPYAIWLSETILQQTRVAQGLSYYFRFLDRFPDIHSLANALEEEVLSLWQGLGYYARGRNLHATAKEIVARFDGRFPANYDQLLSLKGIGAYTAAAIASFAFHLDHAVVDGNVIRVISRLFQIEDDIKKATTRKQIDILVEKLLPKGQAYFFNQAIMELGALVCTPKNPDCSACPVQVYCQAYKTGSQIRLPVKGKAAEKKRRYLNYLIIKVGDEILLRRRVEGIWKGLFEPILFEEDAPFIHWPDYAERLSNLGISLDAVLPEVRLSGPFQQNLTHQQLWISVAEIRLSSRSELDGQWVREAHLEATPKPVFFSKFFRQKMGEPLPLMFKSIKRNG